MSTPGGKRMDIRWPYIADTLGDSFGTARHKIADLEWMRAHPNDPVLSLVKMDSPFKTIQDLLKYAKNPGN
jgi:tripartite-type tricarboxylate transporter receptor subunit TctC